MRKTYYKVVSDESRSSFARDKYSLLYGIGITTTAPKGRPLFIFDTYKNAQRYAINNDYSDCSVYKCYATVVRKPPALLPISYQCFNSYWDIVDALRKKRKAYHNLKSVNVGYDKYDLRPHIKGTLWCNSVTLIEQV